jgi:hypothetical protein
MRDFLDETANELLRASGKVCYYCRYCLTAARMQLVTGWVPQKVRSRPWDWVEDA